MTRISAVAVLALLALVACDKPSEDSCRKALLNIQHLLGTDTQNDTTSPDFEGEVRRCRGGSRRAAVDCAVKATTLEELERCDFFKVDMTKGSGSGSSATGSGSSSGSSGAGGSGSSGSGSGSAGSGSGSAGSGSGSAGSSSTPPGSAH